MAWVFKSKIFNFIFPIWNIDSRLRGNDRILCLIFTRLAFIFAIIITPATSSQAAEYSQDLNNFINLEIKPWVNSDIVVDNLNTQNQANATLSESNLAVMDNNWRSEFRKINQPVISKILNSELSQFLKRKLKEGQGVFTQISIINNKGLNIAQTIVTENYWNKGKAFWDKTFGQGSYATYISDIYYSDETSKFQVDVSFMIIVDDQPIGTVYAGIDVEQLEDWKKRRR